MDILTTDFYRRDTLTVARDLLGGEIVRVLPDVTRMGCRITETEAYIGRLDKACHAYGYKRTPRTETLFAPPGTAYIYLIYGMYHCLNFVTEAEGEPAAVLIRGAVPAANGDIIAKNRFGCKMEEMSSYQRKNFLNGPGKLCRAMDITRELYGQPLWGDVLFLAQGKPVGEEQVAVTPRINIDYAGEDAKLPYRFVMK